MLLTRVENSLKEITIDQRVQILWDLMYIYKDQKPISIEDMFFLRRVALRLQIDRSILDLMLK